jgi:hypothetical protein
MQIAEVQLSCQEGESSSMAAQVFTKNYTDHSNDTGFQFEFFCDKCGNGHRSSFVTNKLGVASHLLKAAGSLFGGGLHRAGWGADHVKDAFRGPAWDSAFKDAVEECRPKFKQCTRCGRWVCPEVCFNLQRGLCEECAPDLREHAPAIQAQVGVEQAWEKARAQDQMRNFDITPEASVGAACSKCQTTLAAGAKFCAQCGSAAPQASAPGPRFCAQCGGALGAGARFCAGCGSAVG